MALAQKFRDVKRLKKITDVLYKHELGYLINKLDLKKYLTFHKKLQVVKYVKKDQAMVKKVKATMEELSGAFARFGQSLAVRRDVFPSDYINLFSQIRDETKPIHFIFIKRILEKELKKTISRVFSKFDKNPIHSSSISQTYKAVLKSGENVVVKIQKPDVKSVYETDIEVLYHIASLIERNYKEIEINATDLVNDFNGNLKNHLNFRIEAKNMETLAENLKNDRTIKIPKVYPDHTTSKVLTMELLQGKKLRDVKNVATLNLNKKVLSQNIADSFFSQVIYHNLFHSNPNEDNIVLLKENKYGLLNPGLLVYLNTDLAEKIENILIALVITDKTLLLNSLIAISKVNKGTDLDSFKEELLFYLGEHYDDEFNINLESFSNNLFSATKRHNVSFPKEFIALNHSMITLENSVKKIDSNFNLTESLQHKTEEIIKTRDDSARAVSSIRKNLNDLKDALKNLPAEINKAVKQEERSGLKPEQIRKFTLDINRSSKLLTLGLITAALITSGTLIILARLPPLINEVSILGSIFILAAITTSIFLLTSK